MITRIIAVVLLAATAQAQITYNVPITNNIVVGGTSITNIFGDTFVTNLIDVQIAGVVVTNLFEPTAINNITNQIDVSVAGVVVTNQFAPVNNVTNQIDIQGSTFISTNIVSVTNFIDATVNVAGVVVTNNITIDQSTSITNFIDQFVGINVLSPVTVSTQVFNNWEIDLTTNNPVGVYVQVANITSVTFKVDNTNDVALGEVMLLATTNAITWPTNGLTWATGAAPDLTASEYNRIYFEAWRDAVFGVYVGANP